jgi:CheY-like chemotaxis protein
MSIPRRILIVDDNEDGAEMLQFALQGLGHSTRIAHDGPSALAAADEFRPHVALLDIGLPVMDGYELARRLRARFADRPLVLLAVTGYSQAADRIRAREAGFDGHLVKPLDLGRFETLFDSLMPATTEP